MRKMGVLAAMALAGAPAAAADWRLAAESDRAISYLDLASVVRDGDGARFARTMVLARATAGGADTVRDSFRVECATHRYQVIKAELFQGDRAAGELPASAGTATDGTVLASLIDIACGKRQPDGAAIADPYAAGRARLRGTAPESPRARAPGS